MRHHLSLITLLLFPASLALAQEADAVEPWAIELARLDGFPGRISLMEQEQAVGHTRLWVHHDGAVEFSAAEPAALGPPVALNGGLGTLLLPFWSAFDPPCPGRPARNQTRHTIRDGGLVVEWSNMTTGGTQCDGDADVYDFALRLDVLDEHDVPVGEDADAAALLRITFEYGLLPDAGFPRAGVVLGRTVLELFADEGKPRTDRASSLATGSSERGTDAAAAGVWVVELGLDGALVGDTDGDGIRAGDNCPHVPNPGQEDYAVPDEGNDEPVPDGVGDACDGDHDDDGRFNQDDNCVWIPNDQQADWDRDGRGDACDADLDGDTVSNFLDNCPWAPNPGQFDMDLDGSGDVCDADPDGDGFWTSGVVGAGDTCPWVANSVQRDRDGDGLGDRCDTRPAPRGDKEPRLIDLDSDADGDTWPDLFDNCPRAADEAQADADGDGLGDVCDPDANGDGVLDVHAGRCHSSGIGLRGACFDAGGRDARYPAPFTESSWTP